MALACYFGFALLALSQDRHWERAGGGRDALWRDGPSFGSIAWATMLSISAIAVTRTLTWRANWLRPVVRSLQGIG